MKTPISILTLALFFVLCAFTHPDKLIFPTPPDTPQRLFYIQRSNNIHTVIYDANFDSPHHLHPTEPVKVYWIRYADRGQVQSLTYIQRKMAYGVEVLKTADGFEMQVVAFKKRKITIKFDQQKPVAITKIAGAECCLKKVFVQLADEDSVIPKVSYVALFGKNTKTGQDVVERFRP
jgi:Domain of unknown function (DUF4833)